MTSKTDALSMKERRVLILVNGENTVATLAQISLCDDLDTILERLLFEDFIASPNASDVTETEIEVTERDITETSPEISARELMCNTLLTFGNQVRVGSLVQKITDSADAAVLREMVAPWYEALVETPGGMYQADDLKKEVLSLIDYEDRIAN